MNEIVPTQAAWAEIANSAYWTHEKVTLLKTIFFFNSMILVLRVTTLKLLNANYLSGYWLLLSILLVHAFQVFHFKYFITAPWLYVPILILPHKNSFSTLTFSTLCTWLATDRTVNLFCYTHCLQSWEDCFVPKWVNLHKDTCHPANWCAMQYTNEVASHIYWLSTTNPYLLPLHKINGNAFLKTASDFKLVWDLMIYSVQSLDTGIMYKHRLCILLCIYFLYFPEKSVVLWWFCKSTQSARCSQSTLINQLRTVISEKKFCTLYFGNLQ